ncbi:MAG TPA: AI-2E family transporter [Amaricoccus sp.]|uniref:AI-2E family transporter n=1 Tax=Amaricoccus sp. TaxID=1872485 RepID=UPI002C5F139D|nr:AI-2E family transporter [Amaricoccus sp.]HMQ91527.1 AI-2E family transporter [Amaricoccus sp.]HMR50946.1 AI-2E family transporter [Amaricoccus sp.]HMR58883.1 AI-2E family transporter [Amaricoccus sp.]HMT97875.1 AI-2E family transporter [Amaricoccus sp.]
MSSGQARRRLRIEKDRLEAGATDFVVRLAFLGLFAWWSLELVRPFLPIVIWAILLAVALYPSYAWIARRLGDRRGLAATVLTLIALATVLGPVSVLAASLAESVQWLASGLHSGTLRVPPPPTEVAEWPILGEQIDEVWNLAATNFDDAVHRYGPAVLPAGGTLLAKVAGISADVLKFVVSVVIAGFLFLPGPRLAAGARAFAGRLIAPRGAHFVDLAGATIRNVSRGVIGVALLQALLAGIILYVAGIPGAGLIAFGILLLCIVQIGAAPILLPVLVWIWLSYPTGFSLILTLLLVPVGLVDNVLKPILMARGLTTPMLVILTGVIGGTLTHGLIGLFLGPVVLSVFYELVVAWTRLGTSERTSASGAP